MQRCHRLRIHSAVGSSERRTRSLDRVAEVEGKIYAILVGICGPAISDMHPESDLVQAIALDSLATVRLVAEISNTFDIPFGVEANDLDNLASIRTLAESVAARAARAGGQRR